MEEGKPKLFWSALIDKSIILAPQKQFDEEKIFDIFRH
jgi:hypothetical protein